MENKKVNPLTLQSRQWLLDALLQLMKEKSYNEITIKELTKRAGLDRKTFYRHFKTKDELLDLPMKEAFDRYVDELKQLPELSSFAITKAYFDLCLQYIDFFKLLNTHGLLLIVLLKFSEYFPMLNDLFFDNPAYVKKTDWELIYEAGGFWNVTVHWIKNGAQETPEEMAKIIESITLPLLQEA